MATSWRTINIFLSSTFNDMQGERDAIRKLVVPRLNERLKSRNISVAVTDLRWGIDTSEGDEAMREAKVLHVCMEAIRNTRPYFIALIGERYGWVPSKDRFEQILNRMNASDREIFASVDSPCSVTEMEIMLGAIGSKKLIDHSCFCFRQPESYTGMDDADYISIVAGDSLSGPSNEKLSALKTKIKDICLATGNERSIVDYRCHWNRQTQSFEDFAQFAQDLEERVLEDILGEYADYSNREDSEDLAMGSFVSACSHNFVGRGQLLDKLYRITQYCVTRMPDRLGGIILSGPSGVGKSYVLCALASLLQSCDDDKLILLTHVAGLTQKSVYAREMRRRWERMLRSRLNLPDDSADDFATLVKKAGQSGYRLVALIDAMDVFAIGEDPLAQIPAGVFVVATAVPDTADKQMRKYQTYALLDLDVFSREDAVMLIDRTLKSNFKELPATVRDALLEHVTAAGVPAYTSPLWLNLALTMLMEIGADDFRQIHDISDDVAQNIPQYLREMIKSFPSDAGDLFARMIEMSCRYFNRDMTVNALTYIAISAFGIEERQLEELLGEHWDALEFESLRYWMGSMLQMAGEDRRLKLAHAILTEVALSSETELLSEARKKLSDIDYADYKSGKITLPEVVRKMIYRRDLHGLYLVAEACGQALSNAGVQAFALAVFNILEDDAYTVVRVIDRYFQTFVDCDVYEWGKYWITDLIDITNRSTLLNKEQLIREFENVQTRYAGAELFTGNRWNLGTFLSSSSDNKARMWVFEENMKLYGPGVLTGTSIFWIFSTLESELFAAVRNAGEDETLAPVIFDKLNGYIDRIVSLTGQVRGGDAELRKALANLSSAMSYSGFHWDIETYMNVWARIHSLYLDMWPEFDDDMAEELKASYMSEYAYGADSLVYAYKNGCFWAEHPITPLMEHFDGRNVIKQPVKRMPEAAARELLKPSRDEVDETYRRYKESFPPSDVSGVEKISLGVQHYLAQAEVCFISGDKNGALAAINQCDDAERYSSEVHEWLASHYPNDAVTIETFDNYVDDVLRCIVSGKEFDHNPIINLAWKYDKDGLVDKLEALLLRATEFMLLHQVNAKFLYDDESYESGNYTNLEKLFEAYKDMVNTMAYFGCKEAAVTALRRWLEMCDMTYVDNPKDGNRHYSWAEAQLERLGAQVPARKCAGVEIVPDFMDRVKRVIFNDEELDWSDGVKHVDVNYAVKLVLVTYVRHNTAYTAIFSPSADLISGLDSWKFIINFGDNDITLAGERGRWSFVKRNGESAFDGVFRSARPFHQGRAAVAVKQRSGFPFRFYWGFVDEHGNETVPMIYEEAGDFHCGKAWVVSKGRYGVIDRNGNVIVPCEYDYITSFYSGYTYAFRERKCYRITVDGIVSE